MWNLWKPEAHKYRDLSRDELNKKRNEFNEDQKDNAKIAYLDHAQQNLEAHLQTHPILPLETYVPEFLKQLHQPNLICSFHKGYDHSQALAPIYSQSVSSIEIDPSDIEQSINKDLAPIIHQLKGSEKSFSAGLLLTFPDGRVVIVEPSGHFAGYSSTFPKGRIEPGDSMIQTALKETLEETGFKARVDGKWYGLYQGGSTWVLMFSGEVIEGDPSDCDFETDKVHLVPRDQVLAMLAMNEGAWPYRAYQDFLKGHKNLSSITQFEITGQQKRILSQEAIRQELSISWQMLKRIDKNNEEKQLKSLGWIEPHQKFNRHVTCVPFDSNRVILVNNQYINASYITKVCTQDFIAAQGPLEETQSDFWRMLYEQAGSETGLVVMVTNTIEEGREKCSKYWPDEGNVVAFEDGNLTVKALEEQILSPDQDAYPIVKRSFAVTLNAQTKKIDQLQLQNWPDKGCVEANKLKELILAMLPYQGKAPMTIHCSRGIGRTSSVILAYVLFDQAKKQVEKKEFIDIDIFNIVRKLKEHRRYLIPTLNQSSLAIEAAFQLVVAGLMDKAPSESFMKDF